MYVPNAYSKRLLTYVSEWDCAIMAMCDIINVNKSVAIWGSQNDS
jgi:hypothetical protein